MQTSKLLLVVCACALLAGFSLLRAAESEAQKKAREALRQKMQEGQTPGTPAPAQAAPAAPAQAPAPAPRTVAPATPPPTAAPIAAPRTGDTEAQAKAREALRQKYGEGQMQTTGTPGAGSPTLAWNPGGVDNPAQAKAREALWQKMRELNAWQPVAAPAGTPGFPVAFKPMEPPPSAFSGPKSEKLADLLRKYRADQITPEEYHKQRAALVAGP